MGRESEVVKKNGERDIEGQEKEQQRERGKGERESMEDVETTMEKGLSKNGMHQCSHNLLHILKISQALRLALTSMLLMPNLKKGI